MSKETLLIISQLPGYFLLALVVIVTIKWRQRPSYIKMLGIFGGVSLGTLILQFVFILWIHVPRGNNIVYNWYILFEVVCLLLIFYAISVTKRTRIILLISSLLFSFAWLADVSVHGFKEINSFARAFGSIVLIGASISYFYQLMRDLPTERIYKFPMFWFVTGVLVYNSGAFIFFVLLEYLIKVLNNDLVYYWTFQTFLRAIFNALLTVSVWQDLRNRR